MDSRCALVIATDQYAEPGLGSLAAPSHDAAALAAVLSDPAVGGFDVQVLRNRSAQEVRVAVEDFFSERDRSDTLLLHFSGHGLKNAAGELFLAATDTRPSRLASTAVGSDFVSRQMADSRAERIVLFLDCCYGGAFPRGMVVRADTGAQVLDAFSAQSDVTSGKGRAVVTASSAIEYAFEEGDLAPGSSGSPAVFTGALVDALGSGEADVDGDGWVGLHELFEFVSSAVRRVNPHQTPHLWTFGSQGDMLIARSKVRRIRPTPLSQELGEALASPLAATRFGLVDLLQQRLAGDDLGLASTAFETLGRMVDDDSRRVADSAAQAVAGARPTVTPASARLEPGPDGAAEAELTVLGPPLALVLTVSASEPWLRAEYTEPTLRIVVEPPAQGPLHGSVTVAGLTGTVTVPVEVAAAATAAGPPPRRVEVPVRASPVPPPAAVADEPSADEPSADVPAATPATPAVTAAAPESGPRETPYARWLLGGLLLTGSIALAVANRPGSPGQWYVFYDEATGWHVLRDAGDPFVMASAVSIAASLAVLVPWARLRRLALGSLLGCCLFLLSSGLVFLLPGFAYQDGVGKWTLTVVVTAVMAAVVLRVLRPPLGALRLLGWLPGSLLGVGALLVFSNELIVWPGDGRSPADVFGVLAFLPGTVVTAVAVLALCSPRAEGREPLAAAAATAQLLALYGILGWADSDQLGQRLAVMLPGTVLIVGALAVGLWARRASDVLARPAVP